MPDHRSTRDGGELERRVQAADDLVRQTVVLLCKDCPPGTSLGPAAREALASITPRVRVALEALEDIERKRPLTEEELARRRAFAMIL